MQIEVERMAGANLAAREVAALLDWWALAGADAPVADTPHPWLGLADPAPASVPNTAVARAAASQSAASPSPPAPAGNVDLDWASFPTLDALRTAVLAQMPNAPFADGNPQSGVMLLGEAPSAEDLYTGRPFSGPAGWFLDRMLAAIGLDRTGCYISLLCPRRPVPGTPPPDAIEADLPLTRAHIRLAAPRLILLLGAKPVQALTGESTPIGRIRGQWLSVAGEGTSIPALATFNPAYLLRRPEEKANAWADLSALRQRLS